MAHSNPWQHSTTLHPPSYEEALVAPSAPVPEIKDDSLLVDDEEFILHPVKEGENLVGLAVRYAISVAELKRHNPGLFHGTVIPTRVDVIRIKKKSLKPETPEEGLARAGRLETARRNDLVRNFKLASGETLDEMCQFYLEEHGWDLPAALQSWREDLEFSKKKKDQ